MFYRPVRPLTPTLSLVRDTIHRCLDEGQLLRSKEDYVSFRGAPDRDTVNRVQRQDIINTNKIFRDKGTDLGIKVPTVLEQTQGSPGLRGTPVLSPEETSGNGGTWRNMDHESCSTVHVPDPRTDTPLFIYLSELPYVLTFEVLIHDRRGT